MIALRGRGLMFQHALVFLGILLMAGSGAALARHVGLEGPSASLFAVFAAGILFISLSPIIVLRKKVAALEEELARISHARKEQ